MRRSSPETFLPSPGRSAEGFTCSGALGLDPSLPHRRPASDDSRHLGVYKVAAARGLAPALSTVGNASAAVAFPVPSLPGIRRTRLKMTSPCPTNVAKLMRGVVTPVAADGIRQRMYYHRGVGTGRFDHFRGGALG